MSQPQPSVLCDSVSSPLEELSQLLRHDLTHSAPVAPFERNFADLPHLKDWLMAVRGKAAPLKHPRLAFFAGDDASVQMQALGNPQSPVCKLAAELNMDLQIYDLSQGVAQTTPDHALAYGMMAVQPGLDVLGAGLIAAQDIDTNLTLESLLAGKRHDLAALCGAVIAARLARLPVVMPVREGTAVKNLLTAHNPQAADHIVFAQDVAGGAQSLSPEVALAVALGQLRTAALL